MKAAQFDRCGPPHEVIELVDDDAGVPLPNEVLIEIEATAVMLNDLYCIRGKKGFDRPLPFVPGNQGVGRIVAVGPGVGEFRVGDRVYLPSNGGTWRHVMRAPVDALFKAPRNCDPVPLATLTGNLLTAYFMLEDVVALDPGEWVLQNAANSNCGEYVIRLAKRRGLRSVNVVRRSNLASELTAMGADAVVVDGPQLAERVQKATGGASIRLALDALAGEATARLARCLAPGGTIANYGLVTDSQCVVDVTTLMFSDIRLIGYYKSRSLEMRSGVECLAIHEEVGALVAEGILPMKVAGTYPLESISAALLHAAQTGEGREGKVILTPNTR